MAAVASFHSGDPNQVVPSVLYTVVLYTLILHAGHQAHDALSFAYFASVRIFRFISLQQAYIRRSLLR
jgi:hypothetical protein